MTPRLSPLPESYVLNRFSLRYTPIPPPLFSGELAPTRRDRERARRIFRALDRASQAYYAFHHPRLFGDLFELPPGAGRDRDLLARLAGDA